MSHLLKLPHTTDGDLLGKETKHLVSPSPEKTSRIGTWTLLVGTAAFIAWASLAPLDEGVPAQGTVMVDANRKAVQHLSGGWVKNVLVGEGDRVAAGQSLIRLDEAVAKANFESVRQRYLGLRAAESRLQAELSGLPALTQHPDVTAAMADTNVRELISTQTQLFESRRSALRAEIQGIQASIQGQKGMQEAYKTMMESRQLQIKLLSEERDNTRALVQEGYAPRNRLLELERSISEAASNFADLQGNNIRVQRAMAELQARTLQRQQEFLKEVQSQLAAIQLEVSADAQKYLAAQNELTRTDITAPASGQVIGLAVHTVGGVISPGQKLMDIVPADQPLLLEVRVAPHLIDKVKADLAVDVRFSGFAHSPQLVVEGRVVSVSADVLQDAQTSAPYYLARVAVTEKGFKQLGQHQLQAGMPVEVIFLTGERSLLTYLLRPLTKRLAASLKEE